MAWGTYMLRSSFMSVIIRFHRWRAPTPLFLFLILVNP
jgi:hypothetical protein